MEKKRKESSSGRCKTVMTPSGKRYLKNGRFVKKSRC